MPDGTFLILSQRRDEESSEAGNRRRRVLATFGDLPQAVAAATVVVVLLVATTGGSVHRIAAIRARAGDDAKALLVELEHAPTPPPDDGRLPEVLGSRTVGQHREVIERYGLPAAVAGKPDEVLLGTGNLSTHLAPMSTRDVARCTTPVAATLRPGESATVLAVDRPVELSARRYGAEPTLLRTVPAEHQVRVTAGERLIDPTPWRLEAAGGCLVAA